MIAQQEREIIILILFGVLIAVITVILFFILCVHSIISFIKKKPLPKKLLIATLSGLVLVFSIYMYEMFFFSFSEIDRESMQPGPGPVTSPTGEYTSHAYYEIYGGAAGGVNVWIEVTKHKNNDEKKIIYYSDANNHLQINWVDENTIFINNTSPKNNSIKLDVRTEIYHDRGLACKSWLMKKEYETCYQD